jgi:hypothetical protein
VKLAGVQYRQGVWKDGSDLARAPSRRPHSRPHHARSAAPTRRYVDVRARPLAKHVDVDRRMASVDAILVQALKALDVVEPHNEPSSAVDLVDGFTSVDPHRRQPLTG